MRGKQIKNQVIRYKRSLIIAVISIVFSVSCAVRLYDKTISSSTSTLEVSSIPSQFYGWSYVQALGGRTPVSTANQLDTTSPTVILKWNHMTITDSNAGTIESYRIYRSLYSEGYNANNPFAVDISPSTRTYTDTTVQVNTTYYYAVAAVSNGIVYFPESSGDREIKVIVPPKNMSLVHRWMANLEICSLLGETPDRENNYRCDYIGPGKTSGDYYDLEKSYFVDTVEAGCNYTRGTSCSGGACLGTAVPGAGIGNDGDVYYSRGGTGYCYIKRAGAWVVSDNATDAELGTMYSNQPGLPPFVMVDQSESNAACAQVSVNGRSKTLMSRKLQFAAHAYDSSLTDAEIVDLENASGVYANDGCNSDNGHGAYPSDNNDTPANFESLPHNTTSTWTMYRTGSTSTSACLSRFGIQDMTGNVWERLSDQINTGVGVTSSVVPSNTDFTDLNFDNNEAVSAAGSFSTHPEINLALGIPMSASAPSGWSTEVGTSTGQFDPAKFHGDIFGLNITAGTRAPLIGGAFGDLANGGRFAMGISNLTTVRQRYFGFRCAVAAE